MRAKHLLFGFSLLVGHFTEAIPPQIAYVANACWDCDDGGNDDVGSISICPLKGDGTLAACSEFYDPSIINPCDIVIYSSIPVAYVFNSNGTANNTISICPVDGEGNLEPCTNSVTLPFSGSPSGLSLKGSHLYFEDSYDGYVFVCPINSDGSLGTCTRFGDATFNGPNGRIAISPDGLWAHVSNFSSNIVSICPIENDGTFGPCSGSAGPNSKLEATIESPLSAATDPSGHNIYIANSDRNDNLYISQCTVNADGSLSACNETYNDNFGTENFVNNLFISSNGNAYIPNDYDNSVAICALNPNGTVGQCSSANDPSFADPEGIWISEHH